MYFPIFIDLSDREILMIGGGTIAARRVKSLCGFAGQITVVAPAVCDAIRSLQTEYPCESTRCVIAPRSMPSLRAFLRNASE